MSDPRYPYKPTDNSGGTLNVGRIEQLTEREMTALRDVGALPQQTRALLIERAEEREAAIRASAEAALRDEICKALIREMRALSKRAERLRDGGQYLFAAGLTERAAYIYDLHGRLRAGTFPPPSLPAEAEKKESE